MPAMFAPANPTSDCAFGAVAQGVRKLQFLGRSVRLVVVYARSVYALYDSVRLYERSASLARHRPISEYRLRLESKGYMYIRVLLEVKVKVVRLRVSVVSVD